MSQSITHYVNVSVSLEGTGPQPAGFGTPIFVSDHTVTANRLDGPYTNLADMVTAGFTALTPEYAWASAVFAQQPRVTQVYIGRRAGGDASLAASLDAILAVDPGAWYCINLESRTDADIAALAAWVEAASFPKIAVAQSNATSLTEGQGPSYTATFGGTPADGTYRLIFTGFGLVSPVNVDVVRTAGTPADNTALGVAMDAALDTAAAPAGDLEDVLVASSIGNAIGVVSFRLQPGLAAGTITVTDPESPDGLVVATTDAAIGEVLFRAAYTRTALLYHATDSEYLDGAWCSRCLAFDLDVQKGGWAYKRVNGIAGDTLTNVQVSNLRGINCNYFAPAVMSSGVAVQSFTAQGWMPSGDAAAGRRIDVTTSLDWLKARLEEAIAGVLLRATHDVPFTDAGINRFAAATRGVLAIGLAAGHLIEFTVPEGEDQEGTKTPFLDFPKLADTTTTQRVNRELDATGLGYLRSSIEKVVFAMEIRQ